MQVQWGVAPGAPVQGLIGIAAARAKSGDSIMSNDVRFSAGVDWATETHQVCIVEAQGGKCYRNMGMSPLCNVRMSPFRPIREGGWFGGRGFGDERRRT